MPDKPNDKTTDDSRAEDSETADKKRDKLADDAAKGMEKARKQPTSYDGGDAA